MNRKPVVGDIISINNKEQVCVASYVDQTVDDVFAIQLFDTIKRGDLGKVNPKKTTYQINDGRAVGAFVPLHQITFHEQVKLKTNVAYTEK